MALRALEALHHPVDYALIDRIKPDAPEYLPRGFDTSLVEEQYRWTDVQKFVRCRAGAKFGSEQSDALPSISRIFRSGA